MLDEIRPLLPFATLCGVGLAAAGQLGLPLGPAQVPLGLIVVLFAPGFGALCALRQPYQDRVPLIVLSVPLSLALAVIAGVGLDLTEAGVYPSSMALTLEMLAAVL